MPDKTINGIVTWLKNWFYDETEVNALLNAKQNTLVSGTNIKTINNQSLLGQGNISLQGGGSDVVDLIYPVGSIYMSVNDVNPEMLFGGEWEQIKDKFLLSSGDVYSNATEGGSADAVVVKHNHTQNAHNHTPTNTSNKYLTTNQNISISGSARAWANQVSSGGTHYVYVSDFSSPTSMAEESNTKNTTATNQEKGVDGTGKNMPPYLAVNVWKRTA